MNELDNVMNKVEKLRKRSKIKLDNKLGGIQSFVSPKFEPEELIYHFDGLGQQDMNDLMNEFGSVAWFGLTQKIDKIRRQRNV